MFSGTVTRIYKDARKINKDSSKEEIAAAKKDNYGYGNAVTVQTEDPDRGLLFTLTYAHLDSVDPDIVTNFENKETPNPWVFPFSSNLGEGETNTKLGPLR